MKTSIDNHTPNTKKTLKLKITRVAKINEIEPRSILVWKLENIKILPPLGRHKSLHWCAPHLDLLEGGLII